MGTVGVTQDGDMSTRSEPRLSSAQQDLPLVRGRRRTSGEGAASSTTDRAPPRSNHIAARGTAASSLGSGSRRWRAGAVATWAKHRVDSLGNCGGWLHAGALNADGGGSQSIRLGILGVPRTNHHRACVRRRSAAPWHCEVGAGERVTRGYPLSGHRRAGKSAFSTRVTDLAEPRRTTMGCL